MHLLATLSWVFYPASLSKCVLRPDLHVRPSYIGLTDHFICMIVKMHLLKHTGLDPLRTEFAKAKIEEVRKLLRESATQPSSKLM